MTHATERKSSSRFPASCGRGGIAGSAVQIVPLAAQTVPANPGGAIHNVKLFGATGDGKSIDTLAVNRAIEAANAAGGGTVRFPAGSYLCYSIRLESNVALSLDQNAAIIAADPPSSSVGGYDLAEPNTPWNDYQDYGHNHWHNSLLWGEGLENISIFGPGLIWGRGLSQGYGPGPVAERPGVANKAISLKSCRNVRVSNCTVNSPWDDAICPKSSFVLGYARATENVTIINC